MGQLYQRTKGGLFYGEYYTPEGKRVRRSLKTRDKVVAKERLRLAELGASPQARGRRLRLMDAINEMIATMHDKADVTKEFYREKGRRLLKSLGNPYLHEIDRDMLAVYIARRLGTEVGHGGAAPHTVVKELITVRRACREACDRGVLRAMPAFPRFSPRYKPKKTWLTPEQFEAMCAELPSHRQRWAALAALAGANLSEVESIEWDTHVHLEIDSLHIPGTKRQSRDRTVPLAPALKQRLLEVPAAERHGFVALRWGNVRRDLHIAVDRANALAAKQAKARRAEPPPPIPHVSPNDLRRTFGSWLIQRGVPPMTIAILMGHQSTRMVEQVYGKLARANLDAAIALLPNLLGAPPAALPSGEEDDEPPKVS